MTSYDDGMVGKEKDRPMNICCICGGDRFGLGPGGRMSSTGKPPRCLSCQSLERHRIFRGVFSRLVCQELATFRCLQFSLDMTAQPEWFGEYEVSVYGGQNSLDLQHIDRPNAAYDVVICNHVLEHVGDDKAGLCELVRILSPKGFVFLSVPSPLDRPVTVDWGKPDASQHGHYRLYGSDFAQLLKDTLPSASRMSVIGVDPITMTRDVIFFLCNDARGVAFVKGRIPELYTHE